MDDLLFRRGGELSRALEAQAQKMREAVAAEPEESLKQADVDAWTAALAHHFAIACPVTKQDEVWQEPPQDVKIDVSWDTSRSFSDYASDLARNFPGYRVVVHLPFEGDAGVFDLQTSSSSTTWPRGRVKGNELLLTIEWAQDQQPQIDGQAGYFIDLVEKYLGWARVQIEAFNSSLEHDARKAIEARRSGTASRLLSRPSISYFATRAGATLSRSSHGNRCWLSGDSLSSWRLRPFLAWLM